jgi:glycyl-tRNA synthetase beta chain
MVRVLAPDMAELLLELLSEEIPARMQRRAIEDLTGLLRDKLAGAEIPAANLRGYVTPRRLAVIVEGISPAQPDRTEERRGPRVGAPLQAIEGFLRSVGLADIGECEIRDTGRGEFHFAAIKRAGRPAAEVLPDIIKAAIAELPWQKSMRWPGSQLRWVRPLTSVLCIHDGEVLPLSLDGVPEGRTTRGHRFLSPGEICIGNAAEYLEKLQHAYVIVDQDQRGEVIRADLDRRAAELGVRVKPDPGLLDEVTGLAEFPVVLAGAIDADFMTLPPEVLQTVMRVHQKYFSCSYPDGRPAPHFLFVANNLTEDRGNAIIAGNERVLRARLADARFFWDQDRKVRLEDRVEALKDRVYHDKLGDLLFKAERIAELAGFLVDFVPGADATRAVRTARLAKADLSSAMIGEFPELQGIMGRYYALNDGAPLEVADAIADHYKPVGPSDDCPNAPDSIAVALADKIDSLVGFFGAANERPTGSRDPFALRRAAQGVIRLVLENCIRLPLAKAFRRSFEIWQSGRYPQLIAAGSSRFTGVGPFGIVEPTDELLGFIAERLKIHLRGEGLGYAIAPNGVRIAVVNIRHDLIAAVFALAEDDLVRLLARAAELAGFIASEDGANLLIAYRRAANIVAIEERRDKRAYHDAVDPELLIQPEEKALAASLDAGWRRAEELLKEERYGEAMAELARLRRPVDEFFEKVTVNIDNARLRENRLRLLSRIRATMNRVADFSLIEG